jgi:ParB-like nuclease family protein
MAIMGEKEKYGSGFRRLERVKVSTLKLLNYNPKARTEASALRALREDIEKNGLLVPIHVNGGTNEVEDGNRRYTVASDLGIAEVVAYVYYGCSKAELKSLYVRLNELTRPFSGPNKLEAELRGGGNGFTTSPVLKALRALLSKEEVEEIVLDYKIGPSSYKLALQAGRFIGEMGEPRIRQILLWLVRQRQHSVLKKVLHPLYSDGAGGGVSKTAKKIREAIDGNYPLYASKRNAKKLVKKQDKAA